MESKSIDPSEGGRRGTWPGAHSGTQVLGEDRASREILNAALTAGGAAAWCTNLETRQRWWSPQMFAVHGCSPGGEVPSDYMVLVHPDDRVRVTQAVAQSVADGSHQVVYRVIWSDGSIHWIEGTGRTMPDATTGELTISGICTLLDERQSQEVDLRFLALASAELASTTDYQETLQRVANLSVPHFADWCAIDMLDAQGQLRRVAVAHADPDKVALAKDLHGRYPPDPNASSGTWNVIRTGRAELMASIPLELLEASARDEAHLSILRSLDLQSYMGLPIPGAGGRILGAATFVSCSGGRTYGTRELQLAGDLVARAAVAIQNAELFRALKQSNARQLLLLELTDILRSSGTTHQILERVSALIGSHFDVDRSGYGHVDEQLDSIEYDVCWTDGTVPPLLGTFPASAFGQRVIDRLRTGETIAIANVREHPYTSDQAAIKTSHEVETRAILVVPLFKAGRLRTIVYLNQGPQREWTSDEIYLMEEVAERTRELIERGRAESALRASELRWRGLFERMSEGFFTAQVIRNPAGHAHDFRFLEVNPAFERLTGVPPSLAANRVVSEVIPGLQLDLIEKCAKVAESGDPDEFEVEVPALDHRWYEARASRIGNDQFSVMFVEVTARKHVEKELLLSAQRYKTLFNSIDEGFCIVELYFDSAGLASDYLLHETNPAFERHSGLVNAAGRTIRELVPGVESSWIERYGTVARSGNSTRFETFARGFDRWFDVFAFRIGSPEQRRVAILFTDITERKLTQNTLMDRESQLHEAQRLAGIGSWFWHPITDTMDASPELLRMLGFEDNVLPTFAAQRGLIFPEADWLRLNEALQQVLTGKGSYSVDVQAFRRGEPIWVTSRGQLVKDSNGNVVGLRGTLQEITARKATELALRDADERKNEFLATLAHELRNPLAPLRTGLSILERTELGSSEQRKVHQLMGRQVSHLVRLVDDLLDVSRISRGSITLQKSVHSLDRMVQLALETSRPLLDAQGHHFSVDLPAVPVLLNVDSTRIAQVLSNILNNAAKYTPPGGEIRLVARRTAEDRVRIEIEDTGVGIPGDMLERIFDLFSQVSGENHRTQGGLGIGLSLVRQLVNLHGGTVQATSNGLGRGSRFTVELPATAVIASATPEVAAVEPLQGLQHRKPILVVDDNVDAALTLATLLELDGHDVTIAHSGADGLEAAAKSRPAIVFLDIGLPDINGYEVARLLRRQRETRSAILVAVTGWGAERDKQRGLEAGFDLHLTKPVSAHDLSRAIERACDGVRTIPVSSRAG